MLINVARKIEIVTWQSNSRTSVAWGKRVPLRAEVIAWESMQATISTELRMKPLKHSYLTFSITQNPALFSCPTAKPAVV